MQFGVWESIHHWGRFRPERVALRTLGKSLSYGEFDTAVRRVGSVLRASKLTGKRVGLALRSRVDFMVGLVAILREGKAAVVINPGLDEAGLKVTLKDAKVAQLLLDHATARIADLAPVGRRARVVRFDEVNSGLPDLGPGPARRPRDEWGVLYSSGTTGTPKGIERDHNSVVTELLGWCLEMGLDRNTSFYIGRPIFYTGGLVLTLATLLVGGAVWLNDFEDGNDPEEVWRDYQATLARGPIRYAFFIPDQIRAFCRLATRGAGAPFHAHTVLTMGAPITGEEKKAARDALGCEIVESWGNTESLGTITDPEDLDRRPNSIGRPFLSDEMCIVGEDRKPVAVREVGRIAGGQEAGFVQYSARPEATQRVKQDDLIISEDIGYVDEAGYFYIRGRELEAVIRNGTTVFLPELEGKLRTMLGTDDCCACAVGDQSMVRICCLTTSIGNSGSTDEALRRVNERLAQTESLNAIVVVASIPRLPAGKIDRVRAQALVEERLGAGGMA